MSIVRQTLSTVSKANGLRRDGEFPGVKGPRRCRLRRAASSATILPTHDGSRIPLSATGVDPGGNVAIIKNRSPPGKHPSYFFSHNILVFFSFSYVRLACRYQWQLR